ncbi:SDR family NAD(P)-dependent oxidoreductase [Conexibacter sp. JD483]|uniref:SDR family NAD(P)-dependent oxidoreductase n=1 Tax=unclassified Conexibacter TaxID=2627773 RepID=UPI002715C0D7|nr:MULTISPECIES: SDR family NAD(P)-dependent oxidoreductase [unclassified Conexibacter]MDO8186941.1 SDR family NAD(P)-dependent oxidoreductase [Conexibacter sp. CPCC 205706]MDO8200604.1 SDR family NAD(P)-dependent oxidoreductase [Conexibacter sp. CPCC 205762]MDR9368818.1 SDR family NAD(P)-dependent oxidoreductase [Conexibacter sp. JD483]
MKAIVTGAARGLGEGIARRLVADGGDVALLDAIDEVETTAATLAASGGRGERDGDAPGGPAGGTVVGLRCDVSDEAAVSAVVAEALERLGGVDLLVNCAGIGGPGEPLAEVDAEAFRRTLDVNLTGSFLMARAVAPALIAQRAGSIVNIGSIFGQQGVPFGAAYSSSKGGVTLLTHSLALELAPHRIRVNAIAPGHMESVMHFDELRERARRAGISFEEEVEKARAIVPLGRHGNGADVAGAVVWLASPDASYVTGQTINVNGGLLLS